MLYLYGPDRTVLKIDSFLSELIVALIVLYGQWANGIVCDWPTVELNHTQHHRRPYGITTLRRKTAVGVTLTFNNVFLLVVSQINDKAITTALIDYLIHTAHGIFSDLICDGCEFYLNGKTCWVELVLGGGL